MSITTVVTTVQRGNWSGKDFPVRNGPVIAPWQDRSGWCIYTQAHIIQMLHASRQTVCTQRAPDCILQVINLISV